MTDGPGAPPTAPSGDPAPGAPGGESKRGPRESSSGPSGGSDPNEDAVFDASWLELREPVDHRARSVELVDRLRKWWMGPPSGEGSPQEHERGAPAGSPVGTGNTRPRRRIVDLGSGTGSNLRYLAPRLGGAQEWILTDHDPDLLSRAVAPEAPPGTEVEIRKMHADLGRIWSTTRLEATLTATDLVTSSAFLDLASPAWIEALAQACRGARTGAYVALTYDGTIRWWEGPELRRPLSVDGPTDAELEEIVNAHQRRDKGLGGVAAGPDAAAVADQSFRRAGFLTWLRPSPWRLGPDDVGRVRRLLRGWKSAAVEARPDRAPEIHEWADRRRRRVDRGVFGLTVGHLDLLALPSDGDGSEFGGDGP